jgi:hypothetical protein
MRRADPTRLYYVLEFLLSMPTWVAMSVYLVSGWTSRRCSSS